MLGFFLAIHFTPNPSVMKVPRLASVIWHTVLEEMSRRRCFGGNIPFQHVPTLWHRRKAWEYIGLN